MNRLVIYHDNCYDGFGAAFTAWKRFKDGPYVTIYYPAAYGQTPIVPYEYEDIFLLDFCYPSKVIQQWLDTPGQIKHITIIDHHKTALEDIETLTASLQSDPRLHINFDMNESGASLAWKYFFGYESDINIPDFIHYLRDRDLWKFQLPMSREVSMAMRMYPFDFRAWEKIFDDVERLKREGVVCRRMTEQQVETICKDAEMIPIAGYQIPIVNTSVHFSEIGEYLLEQNPDVPFAGYYYDRNDGKRQWGFRSKGDFDVSEICKKMGGGGHKNAAGFTEDQPISEATINMEWI